MEMEAAQGCTRHNMTVNNSTRTVKQKDMIQNDDMFMDEEDGHPQMPWLAKR